ncbi:glutamine-hydrolyzing GMP synthase [Candidatus Peregrinibacteria bacterium]|jgi:GMP synthase (glutamine-hydrolysing)|nr:glutamine-hydrolyzing GMP synthase [Candidatus Peregrinibacteria bacterium]MBT4147667.1 glutamine-hydrolyzing GMP synthase [Candidatus Peregrinibacteria bacterium]MBT4455795.1 glutamine-hydrolyzing GMP synthase [Candidatus Peregrinibacteria bacterium]
MDKIVVLDFGGQYAHLIANRIRRLGVYSDIRDGEIDADELRSYKGVILSGGPQSVHAKDSLQCDPGIFGLGVPVLGICYGHQVMAHVLDGIVEPGKVREYGRANVQILDAGKGILDGLEDQEVAWMSHFDQVAKIPEGFEVIASTDDCKFAGMANEKHLFYGLQFHPEVTHTPHGMKVLENFVEICQAKREWSIEKFIAAEIEAVREKVGDRKVFMLVSGGVDSTVAFTLLEKALGNERVYGLFVDIGFMRKGERDQVEGALRELGVTNLKVEDASNEFFEALREVYDPEEKRAIIGAKFIEIQKRVLGELGLNAEEWILGQGTIYPDTIETGGTKHADTIKTHHNRVPEVQELIDRGLVIEPIAQLYKDEVRKVGESLGLPNDMVWRHPFPGPGLAVRCLCSSESGTGEVVDLDLASDSDGYAVSVLPLKSVGVQGDVRSYKHPVVLSGGEKDWDRLALVGTKIVNKFAELNRALYLVGGSLEGGVELVKSYLTPERIAVLQEADKVVMDFILEKKLDREIWQFPTVLVPLTVGGSGSGESVVLRPVESEEAMTASFYKMEWELLDELVGRLAAVEGVGAIFYDITNKPPGTIEWE